MLTQSFVLAQCALHLLATPQQLSAKACPVRWRVLCYRSASCRAMRFAACAAWFWAEPLSGGQQPTSSTTTIQAQLQRNRSRRLRAGHELKGAVRRCRPR